MFTFKITINIDLSSAVSKVKDEGKGKGEIYRVIARNEAFRRVYKFDSKIRKDFPMIVSGDFSFLAILGKNFFANTAPLL